MKIDLWTRAVLWSIAVMLILNLTYNIYASKPALAGSEREGIGRYQISSWAAQSGRFTQFNGYYVLDTVTGKVVEQKTEKHSIIAD